MKVLMMYSQRLLQAIFFLLAFTLFSCQNNDEVQPNVLSTDLEGEIKSSTAIHYGPATAIGDGSVRVWVEMVGGKPVSLGIELTEAALSDILNHHVFNYALKLPGQAHATGFKTITLGWNPEGHEPDHIYTLPHFDLHFYMLTEGQIRQIDGGFDPGAYAIIENGLLPSSFGFGPPGSAPMAVPRMGLHWVDFTSPEFSPGGVFTKTFIYGSHQDRITFLEPMFTLDYLLNLEVGDPDVTVVPSLLIHESPGYYPGTYTISRNANGTYTIALTDLDWHNRHR